MLISVAIPTYKRLPQLKRAVGDVFAQTWKDWELIISDDEVGYGETWQYLQELAKTDSRIRVLKNERGGHGQVYNVNSACFAAKGDWVKVFFDDDRLLPNCLEVFAKLAEQYPEAAMIRCRSQIWRNGNYIGDAQPFKGGAVEFLPTSDVLLAMCKLDSRVGGIPTEVMIRGDLIRHGIGMKEDGRFVVPVDTRWYGSLLRYGGLVTTKAVLTGQCQGEVASVTSENSWKNEVGLTEETRAVYHEIYENAARDERWPSARAIDAQICGVRALYHLTKRQWSASIKYCFMVFKSLHGILLTMQWLGRRV